MNWKEQATSKVSAPAFHVEPGAQLAQQLTAAVPQLAQRDKDFALSLLAGFDKYNSFTARQLPYVQKLIEKASAPANAEPSPDAQLAARLQEALSSGQVASSDTSFAQSLLAGFERYGSFSDRQRPYAQRMAAAGQPALLPEPPATGGSAPAAPPIEAVLAPRIAGLLGPNAFARLQVGNLLIVAKNDFSMAWIKWEGQLSARMSLPGGEVYTLARAGREAADATRAAIAQAEVDPLAALKQHGLATGRCGCCGRALTDPVSISKGLGPICLAKFQ